MNAIAALAAKEAAVVSGFGAGLLAPSAVDGFAVGTLLSGVCVLMVIGPRRRLRHARQGSDAQSSQAVARANTACTAARTDESPTGISGPLADEWAEALVPSAVPEASTKLEPAVVLVSCAMPEPVVAAVASATSEQNEAGHVHDSKNSGYRSKHRMTGPYAGDWRPESRRSAPRHAAPSHRVSSSLASRLPLYPLPVRD